MGPIVEVLRRAWFRHGFLKKAIVLAALMALGVFSITWFNRDNGQAQRHSAVIQPAQAGAQRLAESFGKLSLSFEPNAGQADASVTFLSRAPGYALFLSASDVVLSFEASGHRVTKTESNVRSGGADVLGLAGPHESHRQKPAVASHKSSRTPAPTTLHMRLAGANPAAAVSGLEELPGKRNYLIGNDPAKWRTNVPTYAKVKYQSVYPGIDLVYYGNPQNLEYDFLVTPGADPSVIALDFSTPSLAAGELPLHVDSDGDLVMQTGEYVVRLHKPVVYQTREDSAKHFVDGKYMLTRDGRITFALAAYDRGTLLVIDPVLTYSTYVGGSSFESSTTTSGIAVDASGHAYVTGTTFSTDFPTANPLQAVNGGGDGDGDAFVAKLTPDGSALVYATYLGGSHTEYGQRIAVDASGHAYVTGLTASSDFPTVRPLQVLNGPADAFVAKVTPDGSALVYSTYLGGSSVDNPLGIAVDAAGSAYVTGLTSSTDFPTANPLQSTYGGNTDGFVAKLTPDGSTIVYSTYLGGSGSDVTRGIAVDAAGSVYVTGSTTSPNFPTARPLQGGLGGGFDAFVAKVTPDGSALVYSTYLGGSGDDGGEGIAVDTAGSAYVTGATSSTNFPLAGPLQVGFGGVRDAFVAKLTPDGSALVYATYLGGSGGDFGSEIAIDVSGRAYVTGFTSSADFPTANPLQAVYGGNSDGFVSKLTPDGSALAYSTYLGGSGYDVSYGIAVDASGAAYVTGVTSSADFPTANPLQAVYGGNSDAFVAKIGSETKDTTVLYEIVSRNSDKCLDVYYASTEAAASVIQWTCHGGANQQWLLKPVSDGAFRIIARHSGQVLDVYGGLVDDVAPIIQFPWHGGDNQLWTLEPAANGYMFIVARHSGKVLDVKRASADDGARVIQYMLHGGANQQWLLHAVAPTADSISTVSDHEP